MEQQLLCILNFYVVIINKIQKFEASRVQISCSVIFTNWARQRAGSDFFRAGSDRAGL